MGMQRKNCLVSLGFVVAYIVRFVKDNPLDNGYCE